jgi:hypothetical protein
MPKGQQRSNREVKKPKQTKKSSTPPSSSVIPQPKFTPAPGKKK